MNPIQNMMFLSPAAVIHAGEYGTVVRNDNAELYTVKAKSLDFDDGFIIVEYSITRQSDGANHVTQIFDNVIKYVAGVKPF